jgi:hypothetical protein
VLDDSVATSLQLGSATNDWSDFNGVRIRGRAAGSES